MINLLIEREEASAQIQLNFYLQNVSSYSFSCTLRLEGVEGDFRVRERFVKGGQLGRIFVVPAHFVKDHLRVDYSTTRFSTMGLEGSSSGKLKIKARDFARKNVFIDELNATCLKYPLWEEKKGKDKAVKLDFKPKSEKPGEALQFVDIYNTKELVEFDTTIDLHIEKLVDDPSKVDANTAFLIQMKAFQQFMDKAIRLGVDKVYVIHGLGKGKLRNRVKGYAEDLDVVDEVKNEWDPRFGYGASEIRFK
ncbi:MAG: hypothetical protein EA411_07690 [Saprospirales bacterium]|nr:MAG: hypothetical protein EA411_07690 [Saprospirales bacterium]